jgi:fucose permease
VSFTGAGLAMASWAARIPQVRDHLHMTPGQLGVVLLCIALGSIVSLPLSGAIVAHFGEARTVVAMSLLECGGLAIAGVGYVVGVAPVCIGLVLFGLGTGGWDVAMNVQGATVERTIGRSIMARFHAGWSIGTVAGAAIGAAMVALHVPVTAHLVGIAVVVALVVPITVLRGYLPHVVEAETQESRRSVWQAWREPRTLLIGVFVLCMAFSEGTGNDWIGVVMIDAYHTVDAVGTLALAVFLAAMTLGRWFGPALLDRFGRVPVLRTCAVVALVGVLLVVFAHNVVLAFVGVLAWGVGTSLGFPTGISAAADDPRRAAARVSVASSVAYLAFLGGPPLVGFVADHVGVLHALTVVSVLVTIAVVLTAATAPLASDEPARVGA